MVRFGREGGLMNRALCVSYAVILLCAVFAGYAYAQQSDDAAARASFESLVKKLIDNGAETISAPYKTEGGFRRKKWLKSDDVSYDIRKTDSIVSPYIAVLTMSADGCVTNPASSPDAIIMEFTCKKIDGSSVGIKGSVMKQKYQFAYQDGKWMLKNTGSAMTFLKAYNKKFGRYETYEEWNGDNMLNFIVNEETVRGLQE